MDRNWKLEWTQWFDKGEDLMQRASGWTQETADQITTAKLPMKKGSAWEIVLNLLFPGLGQIVYSRWSIGIPLMMVNGITIYILWFIIMPISLGILLHDRRMVSENTVKVYDS